MHGVLHTTTRRLNMTNAISGNTQPGLHTQFCRVWSLAVYIDARLNWLYGPFTRRKPPHIRQVLMLATLDKVRGLDHQQVLYGRLICIINNESGFPIFRIVCWLGFHHGHGISRPRPNGRPSPTFFTSWVFCCCAEPLDFHNQRECSRPSRGRRFVAVSHFLVVVFY